MHAKFLVRDSVPDYQLIADSCTPQFPVQLIQVIWCLKIKFIGSNKLYFTCWLLSVVVSSTSTIFAPGVDL